MAEQPKGTTLGTLAAFWQECFKGSEFWSPVLEDGQAISQAVGSDKWQLRVCAYWHCCPRCLRTTTKDVLGEAYYCKSCNLLSRNRFRCVTVLLSGDRIVRAGKVADAAAPLLAKIGAIGAGLASSHPMELPTQGTIIDLDRWNDFINMNDAVSWEARE